MVKKASLDYFRAKGLLPFQAEFVVSFLERAHEPYRELVAPVGAGKTRTAAALIAHEMENDADKRVLVLAPTALLNQWQFEISSMLSSAEPASSPLIVDRKTYLELESHVPVGESPWPLPAIILMSVDLAKRDDMAAKLSGGTWDIAVFDESHLLTGKRRAVFEQLTTSGSIRCALLLTATPLELLPGVARETVNLSDVVDWHGKPLYAPFERKLISVNYQRIGEEHNFLKELQEFATQLANMWPYGRLQEKTLLRAASSSIYSAEGVLHRLGDAWRPMRNKIAHGVSWTDEELFARVQQKLDMVADVVADMDEVLGDIDAIPVHVTIQPREFLNLYQKLESLTDQIEEIKTDSKLDALIFHLRECYEAKAKPRLCIWTSFTATIQYLGSSLQQIGKPVFTLTSAVNPAERAERMEAFRDNGGILFATDAALAGIALAYVDECINYDLPGNADEFEQRWGRFVRLGRTGEFKMVVLTDISKALLWEEELLEALEDNYCTESGRS